MRAMKLLACLTAVSLVVLALGCPNSTDTFTFDQGGITRGDRDTKMLSLVFTSDYSTD